MSPEQQKDAFALYNEHESVVPPVVGQLALRGLTIHYWTQDAIPSVKWREHEAEQLRKARYVLVFLGESGWGKTQRHITQEALDIRKPLLPVLIGEASRDAMVWRGLFVDFQYVDLRKPSEAAIAKLEEVLRRHPPLNLLIAGSNVSVRPNPSQVAVNWHASRAAAPKPQS